jgi:hypothetical protein
MITGEFKVDGVWVTLTKYRSADTERIEARVGDKVGFLLPQSGPLGTLALGEQTARLALRLAQGLILA